MKEFIKRFSLILIIGLTAFATKAVTIREGGIVYFLYGTTARVLDSDEDITYANIKNTVSYNGQDYTVTAIEDEAFYYRQSLTSVTIPNSIKTIGTTAFEYCFRLKEITIPSSVISIGFDAFAWCSGLEKVEFASIESLCSIKFKGEGSNPLAWGHHLYIDGKEITELTIPNSVKSIGNYSFPRCWNITKVTIPNSVTSIGNGAFMGCTGLTEISIPNSVTSIGANAFEGCSGVTKVEFASIESLCSIKFGSEESNPLYFTHHLYIDGKEIKEVTIPNSVKSIGQYAFIGCPDITKVTIPNSVTDIGNSAFLGCSGLTKVTIPNSVTYIGENAFDSCNNLKEVSIGNSVKAIGSYAFKDCDLTKAEFASIESLCSIVFDTKESNPLYYTRVININGKEVTEVKIPDFITSVGDYNFIGCSGLTSVTIPNSVTKIGASAFEGCSGLTKVKIPYTVKSIGERAFYKLYDLTSITIPESITTIGQRAFEGCIGLTSIYYGAKEPISCDDNIFTARTYEDATLYVPKPAIAKYETIKPWSNFIRLVAHDFSGIDEVSADFDADVPFEVYNLSGVRISDSLEGITPGIYIVRQGNKTRKVTIK